MQYLKDNAKNKIYLCINYPFSNYEHVYFNNTGSETAFDDETDVHYEAANANAKKNIYDFVKQYWTYGTNSERSINNLSAIDLSKGSVTVPLAYKQGINYNYMVIAPNNNSSYDKTKIYYYCFIDAIEWSSNLESATIHFHVDTWNTCIAKVNFFESYIEREHVSDDTYGKHTLDEGITPTEFKIVGQTRKDINDMIPLIAVGSTNHIFREAPADYANRKEEFALWQSDHYGYNPILLGCSDKNNISIGEISNIINYLTLADSADAIIGIYLLPADSCKPDRDTYIVEDLSPEAAGILSKQHTVKVWNRVNYAADVTISKQSNPYSWAGGIKNNKTLTFPFYFLNVSNQLGNELTLKFENSNTTSSITLRQVNDPNINGCIYMYAKNYNGVIANLDYSVASLNYPTIPFIIDSYDSYLAANRNTLANAKNYIENDYNFQKSQIAASYSVNRAVTSANDLISGIRNIAGSGGPSLGATVGNLATGIIGSEFSHQSNMYQINASESLAQAANSYSAEKARDNIKASLSDTANIPDKYCGRYIPNLLMCEQHAGFILKTMAARPEELKAIDNYFTRYGYKVNAFEVPNLYIRTKFDYKKIIDVNFLCEAGAVDINTLKAIFNNGVTIWHTSTISEIFDYTLSNSIR